MPAQRYKVEFTAGEEYVGLVERAKALFSHTTPNAPLEVLHLQAMRLLVAELEKRKFAVTARSARSSEETDGPTKAGAPVDSETLAEQGPTTPRRRGRHVPAAMRRAVFERDDARCSYVDERGERCRETHRLELHHVEPFARDGKHCEANLTLRCASHNALAAEADFGRDFMAGKRDALAHESAASAAAESRVRAGP